eukprot:TRINITY_DN1622_c1_g3_i3.p1 TRINITY_DN1622_c1_g3~~TRINITY_DN1622_c1_g3_i3.p1  ORF type:complete len:101 (-),score=0.82 TRINITY_DN1622_c1_g3_i3:530-802(-)
MAAIQAASSCANFGARMCHIGELNVIESKLILSNTAVWTEHPCATGTLSSSDSYYVWTMSLSPTYYGVITGCATGTTSYPFFCCQSLPLY